jgi:hypothetical protein
MPEKMSYCSLMIMLGRVRIVVRVTHNSDSVRAGDDLPRKQHIVNCISSHVAQNDSWDSSVDGQRKLLAGVSELSSNIVRLGNFISDVNRRFKSITYLVPSRVCPESAIQSCTVKPH